MRTLVLGGNGFIGSHLVDCLLAAGHRVRVMDRGPELFRSLLPGVDYRVGNYTDTALLAEALTDVDMVFHLISTTVPSTSNLDPVADIEGNLVASVRLLSLMREQGVGRIVYLSSGGTVYGIPDFSPIPESHPLRPISSYGVVKVAIENYLFMAHHLHGLSFTVLRASNPYGPRQGHSGVQGVIGTFLWKLAKREQIDIWGDGSVVRDYIHVRDLAALCLRVAESNVTGVFNAGSGIGHSLLDIVEMMRIATGLDVEPCYKAGRTYDVPCSVLDITAMRLAIGWEPETLLDSGIRDTWDWVREHI